MSTIRCALSLIVSLGAFSVSAGPLYAQFPQQGPKLVGTGAVGAANQGTAAALSADGNTAIVGARGDDSLAGAAWVFVRNGGVWTQQGPKLVGAGAAPATSQAVSVSLSADGNTAIVGGETSSDVGAAWIWTRSDGVWTEQARLVGSGAVGRAGQGHAVALSGDGQTAIISGVSDNQQTGAVWIFTRSGTVWSQQGPKLVGSGATGNAQQGSSVALSFDGSTAMVGAFVDDNLKGAAWVWTRTGGVWTQQGPKLVGSTASTFAGQGLSVALSSDGNTALVGGNLDSGTGAAWVWTRSGSTWSQQGPKLAPPAGLTPGNMGWSVSLSADGNTAIVNGPTDTASTGGAWIWRRASGNWTRDASPLIGTGGEGTGSQGSAVGLSADASTAILGRTGDNGGVGAVWVFSSVNTTLPTMTLDRASLVFSAVTSGTAFTAQTSAQVVRLIQSGTGTVAWAAASNAPWLTVSPASGSGSTELTIATQFVAGLAASQSAAITLTLNGASPTTGPLHLDATLSVLNPSASAAPFGSFDTPVDGTTGVTGSIAVTGWALDDVEVTRVRILRDPVEGEPAGELVFIGDAAQVDGARPDVQAKFSSAPRNSRAGWGYLMLTNFLPSLGNGTFRIHAVADDADGHTVSLGAKTITCTNSAAIAPTGAIDTPAQGGVVSGVVTNFGWVISPGTRYADPPHGGTVQLVIDGAFHSAVPSGWTSRADLTALFPAEQYPGVATALGVAVFDSTPLANGVHTIAWIVTDNLGLASGIGSRYFTVSNGNLTLDAVDRPAAPRSAAALAHSTSARTPVGVRRGFSPGAALQPYPSRDGRVTVQAEELDRIEIQLGDGAGRLYTGYLRVGSGLAPLPIGSALDTAAGVFTWMPGVAFTGVYDFVFMEAGADGNTASHRDVRIVLNPKGSNRVGPQTVIDAASADSGTSVVLAGWAADLDSVADTGVDAVHVWGYRVDTDRTSDPIWLGAAAYGGARPDVAAIYGDHFLRSGYGLRVQNLPPGTYDLAVFAYSTVLGRFTPAKTQRVTVR